MIEVLGAAEILAEFGVGCEIWSATSYSVLEREAVACNRTARLNAGKAAPKSWVEQCLGDGSITIAASDNRTSIPKLIQPWVGGDYVAMGTDGFGRSDTRE